VSSSDPFSDVLSFLKQHLGAEAGNESVVRDFARKLGYPDELADRLVAALAPTARPDLSFRDGSEPLAASRTAIPPHSLHAASPSHGSTLGSGEVSGEDPFALIDLGQNIRPGAHVTAMFHLFKPGHDGHVDVAAQISKALLHPHWEEGPVMLPEAPGYWVFYNPFHLRHADANDLAGGSYLIKLEAKFTTRDGSSSRWWACLLFHVSETKGGATEVEIVADGTSLINLHGLDLNRFAKVTMRAEGNSLVNFQSFLEQLEKETEKAPAVTTRESVKPIRMKPMGREVRSAPLPAPRIEPLRETPAEVSLPAPPAMPLSRARLDLPDGRRLLLLPQESLMFGRLRTGRLDAGSQANDVTLRFLPSNPDRDRLTEMVSRNQLSIRAEAGRIVFRDPRSAGSAATCRATIDGTPLHGEAAYSVTTSCLRYDVRLGASGQARTAATALQLEIHTQTYDAAAQAAERTLTAMPSGRFPSPGQRWLRERAGIDAVRIERANNPDDLNGWETYVLLAGALVVGSGDDCAARLAGSGILSQHAALVHWGGAFWCVPLEGATVHCDGRIFRAGEAASLTAGTTLRLGDCELKFQPFAQYFLDRT
jgi:hypothetical protein